MPIPLISTVLFVIFSFTAVSAHAERVLPPLNRPLPGDRPDIGDRVDRDRWDAGGGVFNNYPPETYDPEAAEAERAKERLKKELAREKAQKSHGDPGGGFFNPDQYPKGKFD